MAMRSLFVAIAVLALSACAELTAERPLFSPADQIGPPPLTEGVWIGISEECPRTNVRRRGRVPRECAPIQISQLPDGSWRFRPRIDLVRNPSPDDQESAEEYRFVIAPVNSPRGPDAFATLYVAEHVRQAPEGAPDEDGYGAIGYAVLAPIGAMPATELFFIGSIGCEQIQRQGPIEGLTQHYRTRIDDSGVEHRDPAECIAANQNVVREAARRTLVESIAGVDSFRLVYVRQN